MRKAFKYRCYPTRLQEAALAALLETHRHLYNRALAERKGAYEQERRTVRYGEQSGHLKEDRKTNPYLGQTNFSSCQATLRRLDRAFTAFFRRLKAGEKPGYPRFRGYGCSTVWSSPSTETAAGSSRGGPSSSTSGRSSSSCIGQSRARSRR